MLSRYDVSRTWGLATLVAGLLLFAGCDSDPLQDEPSEPSCAPLCKTADAFGIFDLSNDARAFDAMHVLGVGWARIQFRMGDASLDALTARTNELFSEGFRLWLTLYHRDRDNVADQAGFDRSERGAFPPVDAAAYRRLVQETITPLVDQLRAQGKAPGDWLVIQFANEVLPADVFPPDRPVRFWHGTADEYLATLSLTYDAVKALDLAIPVAMGGISSAMMERIQEGILEAVSWNDRLLREGRFDWADVHLRHAPEDLSAKVAWVNARWNGPLAATEIGGFCDGEGTCVSNNAYESEVQAEDLAQKMTAALEAGVDRVFWASLVQNPAVAPHFQQESLITIDWTKKAAFFAYQELIDAMIE